MDKSTLYLIAGLAVAVGIGTWAAKLLQRPAAPPTVAMAPEARMPAPEVPAPRLPTYVAPAVPDPTPVAPPQQPQPQRVQVQRLPQATVAPAVPIDEPMARQALAQVGADPAAEAVWTQAINDPGMSARDRKNLIEDLNETGFADPRNLTAADLPLIDARIGILERIATSPMDDTNAAAFDEAYKDLLNMKARLSGR